MLAYYHKIAIGGQKDMATVFVRDFPEDLHKKAKMQALEEDMTLREFIIKTVAEYLKNVKKKGGK